MKPRSHQSAGKLRDRLTICRQDVLYHHFCETPLVPLLSTPDYQNDFAVWALLQLGDRVLGERLGIINPYSNCKCPTSLIPGQGV